MRPEAVAKARVRLDRARRAIERLAAGGAFDTFEADWTDFLLASNTVWTTLEQGAKGSPKSGQWFCRKKRQRRDDPLLRYLHQARNADEHGLERVVRRQENEFEIDFHDGFRPRTGEVRTPDGRRFQLPPTPLEADGMILTVREFALGTIVDGRSGTAFPPPPSHRGMPLHGRGTNAQVVGRLALTYQDQMLAEAEALVG